MLRLPRPQNGQAGCWPQRAATGRLDVHDVGAEVGTASGSICAPMSVFEKSTTRRPSIGPAISMLPFCSLGDPLDGAVRRAQPSR